MKLADICRDTFTKDRQAKRPHVKRIAVHNSFHGGVAHGLRCRLIRLTEPERQYIKSAHAGIGHLPNR